MRRQTVLGEPSLAGSGHQRWPDPFRLPVRFTAVDAVADGRVRTVELDRSSVVVRRTLRGMTMRLRVPIRDFLGIAARARLGANGQQTVELSLEHRDPALSVGLFQSGNAREVATEWRAWARTLDLPLLVAGLEDGWRRWPGTARQALAGPAAPRRRRSNTIKRRRPGFPLRRRPGNGEPASVYAEREIIARE